MSLKFDTLFGRRLKSKQKIILEGKIERENDYIYV